MRQFLRNLILGDWLLKLLSLILAVLTWWAVKYSLKQKSVEAPNKPGFLQTPYTDLPITLVSGSSDVHLFKVKPAELDRITLEGPDDVLRGIRREDIKVLLDLSNFSPTSGLKSRVSVVAPPGTACIKMEPEEVEIIPPPPSAPATNSP
jgi:YbbR domain-containing protein